MNRIVFVPIFACALCADTRITPAASTSPVRVPQIGYASSASGLRVVWGTIGASVLDNPLSLTKDVTVLAAASQRYAFATQGDAGQLGLLLLDEVTGPTDFQAIPGAVAKADRVAFSSNGSTAAVYASASSRLQVLSGLPGAPQIAADIDASAFAGLTALAVSDDAGVILVAYSSGNGGIVSQLAADGSAKTIFQGSAVSSIAAIRFLPGSHTVVVVDRLANQLILLSGDYSSPQVLAADAQGVNAPLDLETSTDGRRVFVANSGANNILAVDVASGSSKTLVCGFAPVAFRRLLRSAVAVTAQDGNDVWVIDTDAAAPWVAYVPKMR